MYNLYYRFYRLLTFIGEEDTPRYNAVLLLSMVNMLNILTASMVAGAALGKIIIINLPKFYLFLLGLLTIAAHAFLIFRENKYLDIEQVYSDETRPKAIARTAAACFYIAMTIAAFVFCLLYLDKHPIEQGGIAR